MIWYQIKRPFAFLRINSRELMILRTTVPLLVTICIIALYWALPYRPLIVGDKRYIDYMVQLIGALPGFYIAALAAAATFTNQSLDEEISGRSPPTIEIIRGGQTFEAILTLRVFMCHLFAYLCALSFAACLLGIAILEFAPVLEDIEKFHSSHKITMPLLTIIRYSAVGWFTFYVVRIVAITLHGLFFLIERMHQENR